MKKNYVIPEMDISRFCGDVITASGNGKVYNDINTLSDAEKSVVNNLAGGTYSSGSVYVFDMRN